ncbi:hypothetical protein [Nitrosococcus wardiae]|uniref:Uncharacterized protein n=1 Tax=Nitrosococcus wardiae TaxID=1814290 RepID=A0A4P7BZK9_9GAMM|nr:hypothetical protein [Nitrosococcus wardiae]QBQ55673.1 hypothetical protein E3U44_15000 [Nitrosococcus wardiae]
MSPPPEATPIWRYIRLDEFTCPSPSAKETMRKGVSGFWDKFRRRTEPEEPIITQDELKRLSDKLYAQTAPEPDWTKPVAALNEALEEGLATRISRVHILVGAPFSGIAEVLVNWAERRGIKVIQPPEPGVILNQHQEWLQCLRNEGSTRSLAIPHLERYYLRHHHGLKLIRQLLPWLLNRPGYCVLCCSSWAWAYLSKALQVDKLFPAPWTLEALNQERLQQWFAHLSTRQGKEIFLFRQLDNGAFVIPPLDDMPFAEKTMRKRAAKATPHPEVSAFLTDLAAYSRGNPGIAWTLWRQSLQMAPEKENGTDTQDQTPNGDESTYGHTIWVKPWSQLPLPNLPEAADRNTLQILHTLLLHERLPTSLFIELLPFSFFEARQILIQLERCGLVISAQDEWQLTPLGYPTVRQALQAEGYLVDSL